MSIDVEALKAANPIAAIIGRNVSLQRKGAALVGKCVFHSPDAHPSLHVHEAKGFFVCFVCGAKGDLITWLRMTMNCSFQEACNYLTTGSTATIDISPPPEPEPQRVLGDAAIKAYEKTLDNLKPEAYEAGARSLGVSAAAWRLLGATWDMGHRCWIYPIRNANFKIFSFQRRFTDGFKMNVKGISCYHGLFIPRMKIPEEIYIAEGMSDTAALLTLGVYAIGRLAAHAGFLSCKEFVEKHGVKKVIVMADRDGYTNTRTGEVEHPGLRGAQTLAEAVGVPATVVQPPDAYKDVRAWLRDGASLADLLALKPVESQPKEAIST